MSSAPSRQPVDSISVKYYSLISNLFFLYNSQCISSFFMEMKLIMHRFSHLPQYINIVLPECSKHFVGIRVVWMVNQYDFCMDETWLCLNDCSYVNPLRTLQTTGFSTFLYHLLFFCVCLFCYYHFFSFNESSGWGLSVMVAFNHTFCKIICHLFMDFFFHYLLNFFHFKTIQVWFIK